MITTSIYEDLLPGMLDRLERITFRLRATFTFMQKFGAARDSFEDAREENRPSSFPSLFSLQLSPSLANPFCLSWSSGALKVLCSFLFLGSLTSSSSREFPTRRNGFSIPASTISSSSRLPSHHAHLLEELTGPKAALGMDLS